MAKFR